VAEAVCQRLELRGIAGAGRAVEVEEAANIDVPWLARIEAVEHLDLHPRKEVRQVIAWRQYRDGFPLAHLPDREQALAIDQVLGAVVEPETLAGWEAGTLLQIDNRTGEVMQVLGNLSDPLVDEKIVLAMYNKHDAFDEEVEKLARSFDPEVDAARFPERTDLRRPFTRALEQLDRELSSLRHGATPPLSRLRGMEGAAAHAFFDGRIKTLIG